MIPILVVTVLWAFSFSLIGWGLRGVDSFVVTTVRLGLALLCLLPFLRWGVVGGKDRLTLLGIGALQFGVMYLAYLTAFRFFDAYLVALFSVLTPLWVAFLVSLADSRAWGKVLLAAFLAVAGALVIRAGSGLPDEDFWSGFLLMQVANLAFAGGQVWFRQWKLAHPEVAEKDIFALPYFGGFSLAVVATLGYGWIGGVAFSWPNSQEWLVLVYLGVVASGIGFFLWNYGASRVSGGFLAAANNLVIPLAIIVALGFGSGPPDWGRFGIGTLFILGGCLVGSRLRPPR
ncbi:MAG: EamA family transporter [Opitutales bacterium]|nr:EamA family transporter [Opitutales bacterium]